MMVRLETRKITSLSILFLILAILFSSCGQRSELKKSKAIWDENPILNYSITVRHTESVWHSQEITMRISGDEITHSATCTPAPTEGRTCEVKAYDPQEYTVEGLFQIANSFVSGDTAKWATIEYNPDYGFPELIRYDHPEIIDEDVVWAVLNFEILSR